MLNTKYFIERNDSARAGSRKIRLIRGAACYAYDSDMLDFRGIHKILNFISAVHNRFRSVSVPLNINMGNLKAMDKLSILLFECIIYSLIVDYHHIVTLGFSMEHSIYTELIKFSPLRLLGNPTKENLQKYQNLFLKDMGLDHFRSVIAQDAAENGDLSVVMTNVQMFLQHRSINPEYSKQLAEVVAELIGNATEHSHTSCLLDIDFSSEYRKRGLNGITRREEKPNAYLGVSIAVISFSKIAFEDGLRNKLAYNQGEDNRYAHVCAAREQHQKYFSEDYNENDFLRIVAFQDRISGRIGETTSGGTGLTTLLKSLEQNSDSDCCYLLAGNRIMRFDKGLLDHDENGWIGFNNENDFFYSPPASHILATCPITLPGVAYNLNFVYKKELEDENC